MNFERHINPKEALDIGIRQYVVEKIDILRKYGCITMYNIEHGGLKIIPLGLNNGDKEWVKQIISELIDVDIDISKNFHQLTKGFWLKIKKEYMSIFEKLYVE